MQKLDDEIARLNLVVPAALKRRIESWRRQHSDLRTESEAVRALLEMALQSARKPSKSPP